VSGDLFPNAVRAKLKPAGALVPHPGAFPTAPMPDSVDGAIAQFTEACEAVGGCVSRVTTTAEVADIVLGYLDASEWIVDGAPRPAPFVAWDELHLPLRDVTAFV
jgi:hypothetical protein